MASLARTVLRRGYASVAEGSNGPLVKAPIQLNSLSGKYASAAFCAALKESPKSLDALAKDVAAFDKTLKKDDKVSSMIDNPTLSFKERAEVLKKVLPSGSSPLLFNLLNILSENGRLSQAPKVFADFNSLMSAHRGELEVVVTSAEPLDSKTMTRLEKAFKGSNLADGKTLTFVNRVNPSIIGGLLVDIGDKTIDFSAATRVNRFNSALNQGV